MVSVPRTRTRPYGPSAGGGSKVRETITYAAGNPVSSTTSSSFLTRTRGNEVNADRLSLTSPYEDHDLTLKKTYFQKYLKLNGLVFYPKIQPNYGSQTSEDVYNWSPSTLTTPFASGLPVLSAPNFSYYETMAVKSYNSTFMPIVDLYQFLFELQEFPKMLRDLGRVLQRKVHVSDVPGGFLAEKFGWAPLLSDAFALLDLMGSINSRLNKLRDQKAGRKARGVLEDSSSKDSDTFATVYTLGDRTTQVRFETTRRVKAWYVGTTEVLDVSELNSLISSYENIGINDALIKLFLGEKHVSASTLWNIIPWSWLIDYFLTVGDFVETRWNTLPVRLTNLNLMVHQTLTRESHVFSNSAGLSVSNSKFTLDHKYRRIIAVPSSKITTTRILSDSQNAILAALGFASALKRIR
jgi:hypothetical protein